MKNQLAIFVLMAVFQSAIAQTSRDPFRIRVYGESFSAVFERGDCGFEPANYWGAPVTKPVCGQVVWGYDITGDSLCCDEITADLSGKIVLIRRGSCEYTQKAKKVLQAGAIAVFVVNNYSAVTESDCSVNNMGLPEPLPNINIPAVFISRTMASKIITDLDAGLTVNTCLLPPRLTEPFAEYSYAIPASQAGTMDLISVKYHNLSDSIQNAVFQATVFTPGSTSASILQKTMAVLADSVVLVRFETYEPPAVKGEFKVMYTCDQAADPGDTLYRKFLHTDYTYATDNFQLQPTGFSCWNFPPAQPHPIIGSLIKTGPAGFKAKYATFGIVNAIFLSPSGYAVQVIDADDNNDGINDFGLQDTFFNQYFVVGYGYYNLTTAPSYDSLINVPLTSLNGNNFVLLKPNHLYYLNITRANGNYLQTSYTSSTKVNYPGYPETGFHDRTGIVADWCQPTQVTPVCRLQGEGFDPAAVGNYQPSLDPGKCSVSPNPASDFTNIDVHLTQINAFVRVTLMDENGKIISSAMRQNVQDDQFRFELKGLPVGIYLVLVSTEKEGERVMPLVIGF